MAEHPKVAENSGMAEHLDMVKEADMVEQADVVEPADMAGKTHMAEQAAMADQADVTEDAGMADIREWDVIILGAGFSGLTAAYHLLKNNPTCKILVLEAKDRVGGRTFSVPLKVANGTETFDLGGQWVCRTQHHVLWLLEELGIEQYPQYLAGKRIQQSGSKANVAYFEGDTPPLPLHSLLDLYHFEKKCDGLARRVPCDAPWAASCADNYDRMTFDEFITKETWTKAASEMIDMAYQVVLGATPREYSALFYMFYVSSSISNRSLYDIKDGGAQESKVKGGVHPVCQKLAERIGDDKIVFSKPVVAIDQIPESGQVTVRTLDGDSFSAKYLISSIPLNCEAGIQYRPDPPVKRQVLVGHTTVGHLMKFVATYETTFWRTKGFAGEISNMCRHPPDDRDYPGPLQYVADSTTADGNPALVGFINNSMHWSLRPPEERRSAVLNHLASIFGPEANEPVDYADKDWSRETYNGGCPVNMMTPGAAPYWDSIREPFHRIHYAGTETATQWMGYLSGAVQAGLRAADEVTARLNDSSETQSALLRSLDGKGAKSRGPSFAAMTGNNK